MQELALKALQAHVLELQERIRRLRIPIHAHRHAVGGEDEVGRVRSIRFGAAADRPTQGHKGDTYVSVDIYTLDIYNGSAWKQIGTHNAQEATCSSTLTLTTTHQDITGCTLTLVDIETYLVIGTFDFDHSGAGGGVAIGVLDVGGADESGQALAAEGAARVTVSQHWLITTTGTNTTVKLQARKTVDAGVCTANNVHTKITAMRVV